MTRSSVSLSRFGVTFSLLSIGAIACNGESTSPPSNGAARPVQVACEPPAPEPGGELNAPPELIEAARAFLAARTGEPAESFTITNAAPVTLPLQGASLYSFKAHDGRGNPHALSLSADGAQELDYPKLAQLEQEMYQAANGRLAPDLAERIAGLPDDTELDISLQAAIPEGADAGGPKRPDPGQHLTDDEVTNLYREVDAHRAQLAQQLTAPLKDRLAGLGREGEADELAPIVHARLSVAAIREAARWDEVARVFETPEYKPTMEVARSVVEADIVNSRGFSGAGIKVAEIEVGGGFAAGNPFLAGTLQDPVYACAHPHATWVAGTIRSTHATVRGVAPAVSLRVAGSCFGSGAQLTNRSTAASGWGARAFNLSFGSNAGTQPGTLDAYYDDLVQNGWRTVVASAGNSTPSAIVASPARGYNLISSGSMNDANTIPWLGDSMSPFSSAQDPVSIHGDREKPELAAPGSNIHTTSPSSPWVNDIVSGTSFSAPITTASAALLMQRAPGLQVWPESVKAILMATAVHNVEGASRLSDQDGAGAIVDTLADDVAHGVSGNWGGIGYSCASPYNQVLTTMSLNSNRTTRVAVVWDTNTAYAQYASQPSADLDVYVTDPLGNVVASSGSWDNTYEMMEFVAPMTGTYTVRLIKFRCDLTPKWLGWATYQNY